MTKRWLSALTFLFTLSFASVSAQGNVVVFDLNHGLPPGPGAGIAEAYRGFVEKTPGATLRVNRTEITPASLLDAKVLVVITIGIESAGVPAPKFTAGEKTAITDFIKRGGRFFVVAEESRRTPLAEYGVNDIIKPFGIEFGADTPVRLNVGAISLPGEVAKGRYEVPYAGGVNVIGGSAISIVNDEGGYQHMAYVTVPGGGKIVASGEALVEVLFGSADGKRLSGGSGSAGEGMMSVWGKDSRPLMQDVMTWLLK